MKRFLLLLSVATAYANSTHKQLLILLDQTGVHENVTNNYVSLTHQLVAALQSACCPILVSTAIWKNVLEKKHEAAFAKAQPTAPEFATLKLFDTLANRITELDAGFKHAGYSHKKRAQLLAAQLTTEFYTPSGLHNLKQNKLVAQWEHSDAVVMDQFMFDQAAWQVHWVHDRLLLFVPKNNVQNCGLKLDGLRQCADPLDLSRFVLYGFSKKNLSLVHSLRTIMPTQQEQPYRWTLLVEGHGRNNDEAPRAAGRIRYIADLSLKEFKQVLDFFSTEINMHLLVSGSCQSSGILWQKMCAMQNACYAYPILLSCLTDVTSTGYVMWPKLPFLYAGSLSAHDLAYDATHDSFRVYIDPLYRYKKFFTTIAAMPSFDIPVSDQFKQVLPTIIEPTLNNTPVFLKGDKKELLYDAATIAYVNDASSVHDAYTKQALLVDTPRIAHSMHFLAQSMPRFVSVRAGTAYHSLAHLQIDGGGLDTVAQAFWPLKGLSVDKFFLIDELRCTADAKCAVFSAADQQITLKNVVVHTQKDSYMRLYFAYNNHIYSGHARMQEKQPMIKDLHIVRTMGPQKYATLYQSLGQKSYKALKLAQNRSVRLQRLA